MRSLLCRLQPHRLAPSSALARTVRPSPTFRRTSSSTLDGTPGPYKVFDRSTLLHHRDLAFGNSNAERSRTVGYLREEIGERVMERFEDVKLPDPSDENVGVDVLEITSGPGTFARLVEDDGRVRGVQMVESSESALYRDSDDSFSVPITRTHADEENLLSFVAESSKDAVISVGGLHWVNDLPGVLHQIQRVLKPNGFFLGAMIGGETLFELRTSLQLAEMERTGGVGARVSPMVDPKDVASLLTRAGLSMLTVDVEEITIAYPSMWELLSDLKDMGETNAIFGRQSFIGRDTLMAASAIYTSLHGIPPPPSSNSDAPPEASGEVAVPATFQVVFMMGWKAGEGVQKPLKRGSGKVRLGEVI